MGYCCGYSCGSGSYAPVSRGYAPQATSYSIDNKVYVSNLASEAKSNVSHLESVISKVEDFAAKNNYSSNNYGGYLQNLTPKYLFPVDDFLNPSRPRQRFVGKIDAELEDMIKQAFMLTTGQDLPNDIVINVCSAKELIETHEANGGTWTKNIQGFAVNRKHLGKISEVFVQADELDRLMLTLGHELGHIMTKTLPDPVKEEAKAFAFSLAWLEVIKENNVGGLANCIISDRPANNGLHNVALDFVTKEMNKGKTASQVFKEIIR